MKKIKIFVCHKSKVQDRINNWVKEKNPNIISVNGSLSENEEVVTYVLYDNFVKELPKFLKS